MFSLVWLFGWLARVRGLLRARAASVLREAKREGWLGDVDRVVAELFPYVRAGSYLGWLGQVGFVYQSNGGVLAWTPSMQGVSPWAFREALRKVLRVSGGGVRRPLDDLIRDVAHVAETYVNENARRVVVDLASGDAKKAKKSLAYAREHGHPVARFVAALEDADSPVGAVFASDDELADAAEELIDGLKESFGDVPDLSDLEDELEAWHTAEVDKAVFDAEIALGLRSESGELFAVGWARIPVGPYTCPFCLMLCARGAVYRKNTVTAPKGSKRGKIGAYGTDAFHWGCDCIGVPVFDRSDYEGKETVDAAGRLWKAFTKRNSPDAREFVRWMGTGEGQSAAARLLPDYAKQQ